MKTEWVGCLLCLFEWPIKWRDDRDLSELIERSGKCPICGKDKVVRR